MFRNFKFLLIALVVIIVAGSAYAFAGANTVTTTTKAGEGSAVVSGYTITDVVYTFNAGDPTKIDTVTFTTSALATVVKVKLDPTGTTWYGCTEVALSNGLDWTCDTTAAPTGTVELMTEISVFATDQTP